MWVRMWSRFLPGTLVAAVRQFVGDDLRSVQPPEPEPLRLIHDRIGSVRLDPVCLTRVKTTDRQNPQTRINTSTPETVGDDATLLPVEIRNKRPKVKHAF